MVIKEPKSSPLSKLREYLNLSDDTDREISLAETQTLEEVVLADDREKQKKNNEEALSMAVEKAMSPLQKLSDKFLLKGADEDWDAYRKSFTDAGTDGTPSHVDRILEQYQGNEKLKGVLDNVFGDDGIINQGGPDKDWSSEHKLRAAFHMGGRIENAILGDEATSASLWQSRGGSFGSDSTMPWPRKGGGEGVVYPRDFLSHPEAIDQVDSLDSLLFPPSPDDPFAGGRSRFGKEVRESQQGAEPEPTSVPSPISDEVRNFNRMVHTRGLKTKLLRARHSDGTPIVPTGSGAHSKGENNRADVEELFSQIPQNPEGNFTADQVAAQGKFKELLDFYYSGDGTYEQFKPPQDSSMTPPISRGPTDAEQAEQDATNAREIGQPSTRHGLKDRTRANLQSYFRHYSGDGVARGVTPEGGHTAKRQAVIKHFNDYFNKPENKPSGPNTDLTAPDLTAWAHNYETVGDDTHDPLDEDSRITRLNRNGAPTLKPNRQEVLKRGLQASSDDENEDDENGGEENGGEEEENGQEESSQSGPKPREGEEIGGSPDNPYQWSADAQKALYRYGLWDAETQAPTEDGEKFLKRMTDLQSDANDSYSEDHIAGYTNSLWNLKNQSRSGWPRGPAARLSPDGRIWNQKIGGTTVDRLINNYNLVNPDSPIIPTHAVSEEGDTITTTPIPDVRANEISEESLGNLNENHLAGAVAASLAGNASGLVNVHFLQKPVGRRPEDEAGQLLPQQPPLEAGHTAAELKAAARLDVDNTNGLNAAIVDEYNAHDLSDMTTERPDGGKINVGHPETREEEAERLRQANQNQQNENDDDDDDDDDIVNEELPQDIADHYRAVHEDFETKLENGDYHKPDGTPLHSTLEEAQAAFPIEQQEDQQDDQQEDQQEDGPTSTTPPRRSSSRGQTPTRREDRPVTTPTPVVTPTPTPTGTETSTTDTETSEDSTRHNRMRKDLVDAGFYTSQQVADDTTDDDVYKHWNRWGDQERAKRDKASAEEAKNKGTGEGTPDFDRDEGLQRIAEYLHGKDYTQDDLDEVTRAYSHSPESKIKEALDAHRAKAHNDMGQSREKTENKKKNFDKLMAESQALATSEEDVEGLSPEEATDKAREVVHQIARDAHHYDKDTIRHQQRIMEKLKNSGADLKSIHEELTELNDKGIELGSQAHLDYQEQKNKDALDAAQKEHEDHQARSDALASHLGNAHKHPSHTNANVIHTPEVGEDGKTTGESTAHRIGHDGRGNMYKDETTAGHHPEHGEDWSQMGEEQYHPDAPLYLEHDGDQRDAYQKVHELRHDLHRAMGEDATALAKHAQEGREISAKHNTSRAEAASEHARNVTKLRYKHLEDTDAHTMKLTEDTAKLKKAHEEGDQQRADAYAEDRAVLESDQEQGRTNISNRHAADKEAMLTRENGVAKQGLEVENHANDHSAAMEAHRSNHRDAVSAHQQAHDDHIEGLEEQLAGTESSEERGNLTQAIEAKHESHASEKADMQASHETEQSEMQDSHDETHSQMQGAHQAAADQLGEDQANMEGRHLSESARLQSDHAVIQDNLNARHGDIQSSAERTQETDRQQLVDTAIENIDKDTAEYKKKVAQSQDVQDIRNQEIDAVETPELAEHAGRQPEMAAEHMKAAGELGDAEEEARRLKVTDEQLANPELGAAHEQHAEAEENCDGPPDGVVPPIDAQGNAMKWKCGKGRNWVKDDAHQVGIDAAQQGQAAYFPAGEHGNAMISHGGNIFDVSPPEEGQSVDAMSAGLHNAIGGLNLEGGSDDEPHYIPEDILKDAGIDIAGVGGGEEEEPAGEHQKKGDWMGAGSAGQRIEARAYKGAKDWLDRTIGGTKKGGQAQKFLQDLQEGGSKRDEALGSLLRPGRFARGRIGGEGYAATKGRTSDLTPSGKREMARLASRFMPQGAFERAFGKDMRQQLKREDRHEKSKAVNLLVARYKDAADKVK